MLGRSWWKVSMCKAWPRHAMLLNQSSLGLHTAYALQCSVYDRSGGSNSPCKCILKVTPSALPLSLCTSPLHIPPNQPASSQRKGTPLKGDGRL